MIIVIITNFVTAWTMVLAASGSVVQIYLPHQKFSGGVSSLKTYERKVKYF